MKLVFAYVAGSREAFAEEAESLFCKKISGFLPCEILSVKAKSAPREQAESKRQAECAALAAKLTSDDFVVLFDERGRAPKDSRGFSAELVRALESGKKRVVFIIGGPYGFTEEFKVRAQRIMSLSGLTFNHHVARVVALEQIYRGLCIWKNLPYHND